ncbi:pyrazinamidase/nicotinamidase-like protein [Leptotrombidium deliense]|uniref:nicotinamidase n=1 Tax=Leptotrombidium deliense TaxID=299467 RepID=A0A443SI65_9ACAR|nr:pyrazinamidase/nicotinamidase-like protein [Leptotrombidium deliense]
MDFDFDAVVKKGGESNEATKCFDAFAVSVENAWTLSDFKEMVTKLFPEVNGKDEYDTKIRKLFEKFSDGKELISTSGFTMMWNNWIKTILWPKSAFIIVDVQNDFISGSLALKNAPAQQDGEEVVSVINHLINKDTPFAAIVYTQDWHPENHISFFENVKLRKVIGMNEKPVVNDAELNNLKPLDIVVFEGPPKTEQKLWPRHCVQNTKGAEFHPKLVVSPDSIKIQKGTNENIDSYSAFFDNEKLSETSLNAELKKRGITDVYVCGLAYDVCVYFTALQSNELGYRTVVVDDACRGVVSSDILKVKETLKGKNCAIVQSSEIDSMIKAVDRRFVLGYFLALNV